MPNSLLLKNLLDEPIASFRYENRMRNNAKMDADINNVRSQTRTRNYAMGQQQAYQNANQAYMGGNPQALEQMYGIDPQSTARMVEQFAKMDDRKIKAMDAMAAKSGAMAASMNTPDLWARSPFGQAGIPFEQREMIMARTGKMNEVLTQQLNQKKFEQTKLNQNAMRAEARQSNSSNSENQRLSQVAHNNEIWASKQLLDKYGVTKDSVIPRGQAFTNPEIVKAQMKIRESYIIPMEWRSDLEMAAEAISQGADRKTVDAMLLKNGIQPYLLDQIINE